MESAEAVKEMGSTQLGIEISDKEASESDKEASEIVDFLSTLIEGRKPQIVYPQLPESTLNTPKPDFN